MSAPVIARHASSVEFHDAVAESAGITIQDPSRGGPELDLAARILFPA